jgi:hypothetical protein
MFGHAFTDKLASGASCDREIRRPNLLIAGLGVGSLCGCDEKPGSNAGMQIRSVNNP